LCANSRRPARETRTFSFFWPPAAIEKRARPSLTFAAAREAVGGRRPVSFVVPAHLPAVPAGQLSLTTTKPRFSASLLDTSFTPAKLPGDPVPVAGAVVKVRSAPRITPPALEATTR
jgi:hypothetical protein